MNRRQILMVVLAAGVGASFSCSGRIRAQEGEAKLSPTDAVTIYLHPATGSDSNSGAKDSPLRTLAAAARRVNESKGTAAMTIILSEGVYAVGETAEFKPTNRSFTKESRLTIRAEVLPGEGEGQPPIRRRGDSHLFSRGSMVGTPNTVVIPSTSFLHPLVAAEAASAMECGIRDLSALRTDNPRLMQAL
jgi:hypothetical protein